MLAMATSRLAIGRSPGSFLAIEHPIGGWVVRRVHKAALTPLTGQRRESCVVCGVLLSAVLCCSPSLRAAHSGAHRRDTGPNTLTPVNVTFPATPRTARTAIRGSRALVVTGC